MMYRCLIASLSVLALALPACAEPAAGFWDPALSSATEADWRPVDPERLLVVETTKGRILIEAFPEAAPRHVAQFIAIVRSGDFDGTSFHRVIDGFMAQGGDIFALKGRGSGLPDLQGEFTFRRDVAALPLQASIGSADDAKHGFINGFPLQTQASFFAEMSADGRVESFIPHCPGIVSTARTDDPNSANSQFFLMRGTAAHLDRKYTAWGRVVDGLDVVFAIKSGALSENGAVRDPDILVSARLAADIPAPERPVVEVLDTASATVSALMSGVKESTHICELPAVPARVRR